MGRRANKPRVIPEQDQRICGSICICQLTIVLSCVSIVYLSVAIYMPSYKAFKSGFEPKSVMCNTIDLAMPNNCPWASCGEWCLTKTSGFCPQIHAVVRRNGTDIQLNNCTRINQTPCPQVDPENLKKVNCNNGLACATLNGVFNCSNGHCKNMSEFYLCHHKADGFTLDPDKDNTKLNGFFECSGARCTKIKKPFSCDRYCSKITTTAVNVLIIQDDTLITAECDTAVAFNEARGSNPGVRIEPPKQFWTETDGIMLTSCMGYARDGDKIRVFDCLNGTLLPQSIIPHPYMNFTQFWKIYEDSDKILDPTQTFLPKQSNLTIYNSSRLFINLEGCVNTLKGECKEFVANYGKDGDNNTHISRYQCFYNKHDSNFVVARYDLAKTYRELIIAISVPSVLFVISFISLCIITQSVKVGDDAKMRCKYCSGENSDLEDNFPSNSSKKYAQNLNAGGLSKTDVGATVAAATATTSGIHEHSRMLDAHELAASTKSLIPISPLTETTERTFSTENNDDNGEKPLMII